MGCCAAPPPVFDDFDRAAREHMLRMIGICWRRGRESLAGNLLTAQKLNVGITHYATPRSRGGIPVSEAGHRICDIG